MKKMDIKKIGDFRLEWGESLRWDDKKERLYFVDVVTCQLFWLDNAAPPLNALTLASIPTGIGLAEDGRLVIALDDGLHLIDADSDTDELLTTYPKVLGKRANDATVDISGNFVTGSLNIGPTPDSNPTPGSYWWYSSERGWRQLDDGITNANGPVCLTDGNSDSLVFADTPAQKLYIYDFDPIEGTVRNCKTYADMSELGGFPDGACATADGHVLSCVLGKSVIAHYANSGLQQTIDAGSEQPSDVCFGGRDLDRLFVVNINVDIGRGFGAPASSLAGFLVSIENTGLTGVVENRFRL